MSDQLCTPQDLACFMQDDADTFTAVLCIQAATAVVQSLVGQRIVGDYPSGAQELELARAVTVTLARDAYVAPKQSHAVIDYERAYEIAAAGMDASPHLRVALKLQYDRRVAVLSAPETTGEHR
jgi:hypothetical protein